ncbi:HTH luxR-type domain-containing protein [Frankia sp. AiPs1]|uniref:AAA family ATPase n=1 Tax=Frankia sp. AiPa1 TaxID=573492 RepID=UPI00202B9AA4|nr:LuxR family transcriptional regulator [Frankia sp. AiPa1]MCL9762941.1 AAA family ATPase [Frankia sp. AiPa1]
MPAAGLVLVERDAVLGELRALLADACASRGRFVALTGPSSAGRTAVCAVLAEEARRRGAWVITALGTQAEGALQLGLLRQLAQCAQTVAAASAAPVVAATAGAAHQLTGRTLPIGALEQLSQALLSIADTHPVVLMVDDVHHADRSSVDFLLYLAQRLRNRPMMLVLTASGRTFHCRAELLSQPHSRVLVVEPLSRAGVAALAASRSDTFVSAELVNRLYECGGGSPLLTRAMLDDLHPATGGPGFSTGGSGEAGETFDLAVVTLLHRMKPVAFAVARGIAILGEPGGTAPAARDDESLATLLGQLIGLDHAVLAGAVRALRESGVLDGWRFRHPATRRAVLGETAPDLQARLHRRAAELRYEQDEATPSVAWHLVEANLSADPWAARVLTAAADQALRRDDVELAVRCLCAAREAAGDEAERQEIALRRARAEWRADPAVAMRHLLPLTSSPAADLPADQRLALIGPLMWHGRFEDAVAAVGGLPDATGPAATAGAGGGTLWLRPWLRTWSPPLLWQLDTVLPADHGSAVTVDELTRSTCALVDVLSSGADERAISSAERVLETIRLDDTTIDAAHAALCVLVYADCAQRAVVLCDGLLAEAHERRVSSWIGLLSGLRAEIAFRLGALPEAIRHAQAALTHIATPSWGVAVGLPLGSLVAATSAVGRHAEADQELRAPIPAAMFSTRFGLAYLRARGRHYLATGRPYAALDDFLACGEMMRSWGLDLPALVPWRSDTALARLAIGDRDAARELVDAQLGRPGGARGRTGGLTLRVLAATSERHRRTDVLAAAVEQLQASGDRYELAGALADLSDAQHGLGEHERARATARRARALARECGVAVPGRPIGELGVVPGDLPVTLSLAAGDASRLSTAERRVALLAAGGSTNREIAALLHITVSTVEQHLTQVYRKLKVHRRAELRRVMGSGAGKIAFQLS